MPRSQKARRRIVTVPYSEAAMASGLAGAVTLAVEEDTYYNGAEIPVEERRGCYIGNVPMLKSEAGWGIDDELRVFMIRSVVVEGKWKGDVQERVWMAVQKGDARELHATCFPDERIMFVRELIR